MLDEAVMNESIEGDEVNGRIVIVTVNRLEKKVKKGVYIVSDFKKQVGVPSEMALDQLIDGKLVPLADDDKLKIKGREAFVSHVRTGSSS